MIRQGDVLLVPVKEIPKDAKKRKAEGGRLILARGEATGHHHSFAASSGVQLLEAPDGTLYVDVPEGGAPLEHQEHSTLRVVGPHRVVIQGEYDDAEEWRRVAD